MDTFLHYGQNGLLLTFVCVKMAAVSQKDELEINITFRSFRMEIQCDKYYKKTFKCCQDGYSFSRSLPRAIPEYYFYSLSHMKFDRAQGVSDNLE